MLNVLTALLIGATATNVPPAQTAAETVMLDGVAAFVNEKVITVGDVLKAMGPVPGRVADADGRDPRTVLRERFDAAREGLIENTLIVALFEEEGGQIPPHAIDRRVREIVRERFGGDRTALRRALRDDGMTLGEWKDLLRERMIVSSMRSVKVGSRIRIGSGDVKAYYEAHRDDYSEPATAHLSMIVLTQPEDKAARAAKRKRAEEIRTRIVRGNESFQDVARKVSEGYKAESGGNWGEVTVPDLRKPLARAIRSTDAGGVSEVIETDDGFYIAHPRKKRPAQVRPFDEVRAEIESLLREREGKRLYDAWMDSLKRQAYIHRPEVDLF